MNTKRLKRNYFNENMTYGYDPDWVNLSLKIHGKDILNEMVEGNITRFELFTKSKKKEKESGFLCFKGDELLYEFRHPDEFGSHLSVVTTYIHATFMRYPKVKREEDKNNKGVLHLWIDIPYNNGLVHLKVTSWNAGKKNDYVKVFYLGFDR